MTITGQSADTRGNRRRSGADLAYESSSVSQQCLLCGSRGHRTIFSEFGIDVLQCETCDHVFSGYPADPHFDGYWGGQVVGGEQLYWNDARVRMHRDFIQRYLAGRSGRLLDMGSGLGYFVKSAGSCAGWEAFGCEISAAAVKHAREELGLANVECARLEDASFPNDSFDVVTMWDLLEHVPRPDAVLGRCHALLRRGGLCFIRTPNVAVQAPRARIKKLVLGERRNVKYLGARDHAHFYSKKSIQRLLERNGFAGAEFVHLHPIGSGAARMRLGRTLLKNACFEAVRALSVVTRGRLSFDNLFVAAYKGAKHSQ